jgi:hypothetical protein
MLRLMFAALCVLASAPAFAQQYAAIAYSPSTGDTGTAYRGPTYDSVASASVTHCQLGRHSPTDCQVVIWVADGCAAIAADTPRTTPNVYGVAYANGLTYAQAFTPAQQGAVDECESYWQQDCSILTTVCSF